MTGTRKNSSTTTSGRQKQGRSQHYQALSPAVCIARLSTFPRVFVRRYVKLDNHRSCYFIVAEQVLGWILVSFGIGCNTCRYPAANTILVVHHVSVVHHMIQ